MGLAKLFIFALVLLTTMTSFANSTGYTLNFYNLVSLSNYYCDCFYHISNIVT